MHHYNLHHLLMYRRMEDDLQPVENFEIRLMIYQCNIYLEFHVDLIVFFPMCVLSTIFNLLCLLVQKPSNHGQCDISVLPPITISW